MRVSERQTDTDRQRVCVHALNSKNFFSAIHFFQKNHCTSVEREGSGIRISSPPPTPPDANYMTVDTLFKLLVPHPIKPILKPEITTGMWEFNKIKTSKSSEEDLSPYVRATPSISSPLPQA